MSNRITVPADLVEKFEAQMIDGYLAHANGDLRRWARLVLESFGPDAEPMNGRSTARAEKDIAAALNWRWVEGVPKRVHPTSVERDAYLDDLVSAATVADYLINADAVKADALQAAADSVEFFERRVSDKVVEWFGASAEAASIESDLHLDGVIQGTVTATVDGYKATFRVSLKTNYRYGSNSANGHLTVYNQVPCLVATEEGVKPERKATKAEQKSGAAKARKAELKSTIDDLETKLRDAKMRYERPRNGSTSGGPSIRSIYEAHRDAEKARKDLAKIDRGTFPRNALLYSGNDTSTDAELLAIVRKNVEAWLDREIQSTAGVDFETAKADHLACKAEQKELRDAIKAAKAEKKAL